MSENTHAPDQEVLSALLTDSKGIEIIPRYNERDIDHPNCLVIAPYRGTEHDTALMANVEHYLERQDSTGFPWEITLLTEDPLRLTAAVDLAVRYAKKNNVPVIFLNQDGFSTDAEKQQTGTTEILKLPKGDFS